MLSSEYWIGNLELWNIGWEIWVGTPEDVGSAGPLESSELEKFVHPFLEDSAEASSM